MPSNELVHAQIRDNFKLTLLNYKKSLIFLDQRVLESKRALKSELKAESTYYLLSMLSLWVKFPGYKLIYNLAALRQFIKRMTNEKEA